MGTGSSRRLQPKITSSATVLRMVRRLRMAEFRLVTTLVMMLGMLPFSLSTFPSHAPFAFKQAEALRHAVLGGPTALGDHDHSHDDGAPEERLPGHLHGHNPADHSHETAVPVTSFAAPRQADVQVWRPDYLALARSSPSFGIERPPRPIGAV